MSQRDLQQACDDYLAARTGNYGWRSVRYHAAIQQMLNHSLTDQMTLVDVGAGWTEFDYCLRAEYHWRGRYIPVDGGIDGTDLETWRPPRAAEWLVGLEIIEHMAFPHRLINVMKDAAAIGVVLSTPNPRTTDVLGMDPTHKTPIYRSSLEIHGFTVEERSFYGQPEDSLFAWWTRSSAL